MKRFYVFHNPNFLDREVVGGYTLELVAAVDGNEIEDAFRLTNNIDAPWFENDNVIATFQGHILVKVAAVLQLVMLLLIIMVLPIFVIVLDGKKIII